MTTVFLTVDLAFFGANLLKVIQGGWLPLLIGIVLFTLMTTWKTGRRIVAERLTARAIRSMSSWPPSAPRRRPACPARPCS